MTPFERVRARYRAKSVLGVDENASQEEIRQAYKEQAFAHHPDRKNGSAKDLQSINAAYETLTRDTPAPAEKKAQRVSPSRVSSRQMIQPRVSVIDEVTLARGKALLAEVPNDDARDHVATVIRQEGRKLTFLIPTRLSKGRNRVAVPADVVASRTNLATKVITFRTGNSGRGQIRVPDERVRMDFSGAHEVILQFGADYS